MPVNYFEILMHIKAKNIFAQVTFQTYDTFQINSYLLSKALQLPVP